MSKNIIFEVKQDTLIICDHDGCDFNIPMQGHKPEDMINYINTACPKCGSNLLTERDYNDHLRLLKSIRIVNKWFGWLAIFIPKKRKPTIYNAHCHNGIKIEKEKP